AKQDAIAALPMGQVERIALAFDRDVTGLEPFADLHAVLRDGSLLHAQIRPFGREIVVCTVGGDRAEALLQAGPAAGLEAALSGLVELSGARTRRALRRRHMTGWGRDTYAMGAFAAARPGQARARLAFAEPIGDRLFFAGDACVPQWAGQVAAA